VSDHARLRTLRAGLIRALMRDDLALGVTDKELIEAVRTVAWKAQELRAMARQAIPPTCKICNESEVWVSDYLTWICFCGVTKPIPSPPEASSEAPQPK
jgi:hypothetical protein